MYRSFVKLHSIYASTLFMNGDSEEHRRTQINTLLRVKQICSMNNFRTVQAAQVTAQFKVALLALREESEFLKYLGKNDWPLELRTIQENLLQSTVLDKEILSNVGNDHHVLDSLKSAIRRVNPDLVKQRDDFNNTVVINHCAYSSSTVNDNRAYDEHDGISVSDYNSVQKNDRPPSNDNGQPIDKLATDIQKLGSKNISCSNMSWRVFKETEWTSDSTPMDLILCCPPAFPSRSFIPSQRSSADAKNDPSKTDLQEFSEDCKFFLKPGGYVAILIPFYSFQEWSEAFHKTGFDVMQHPFSVMYDPETIHRRPPSRFPQAISVYASVAWLPSTLHNAFKPDFNSNFTTLKCSMK